MIGPSTIERTFGDPHWDSIIDEYDDEARIKDMPPINAKFENYRALEQGGFLHCFEARDDRLIGFLFLLYVPLPHYSRAVAVVESYFVAQAYRKTGAGLKLLRMAEAKARELGSPGLLVSAPSKGRLSEILPKLDYRETSRVFFKALHDA